MINLSSEQLLEIETNRENIVGAEFNNYHFEIFTNYILILCLMDGDNYQEINWKWRGESLRDR